MSQATAYFVRDDDVGELSDALKAFVETFVQRRLPVSYQVIPAALTQACADYMTAARLAHPDLIEFGQHGLKHAMTLRGKPLLREFGPERTAQQQRADIEEGLRLLKDRLGADTPIQVFTPPQHKYDRHTVEAAAAVGHKVFSAAYYPTLHHQLAYRLGRGLGLSSIRHHGISHNGRRRPEAPIDEVSIAVDVDDGEVIRYTAPAIPAVVERARGCTDTIGFMFHHAMYDGAHGRQELAAIADRLAAYGVGRFRLLGSLRAGDHRAAA